MHTFFPEFVSHVFLRLPVKSLLRFRCLSSSICAEIDSADFVKNHLNRSIQGKIRQKLIICDRNGDDFYSADFDGDLKVATILNNPFKIPTWSRYVGGSCNGLILLVIAHFELFLWNPFRRQYKKIPPCPVEAHPDYQGINEFGLGYDSVLDDYKIVLISEFDGCLDKELHDYYHVWVFSLRSNSWRRCQNTPLEIYPLFSGKSGFANGTLYWCHSGAPLIAFDLANEVFFSIPVFPDYFEQTYEDHIVIITMVVFGGDLYTNKLTADGKTHEFYLYKSDKSGEELDGSWTKAFAVDEEERIRSECSLPWPLAYSKEGDSILFYKKNELFWYNPENKARQRVKIAGIPRIQSQRLEYNFHVCWESLVSLGNDSVFDGEAEEMLIDEFGGTV